MAFVISAYIGEPLPGKARSIRSALRTRRVRHGLRRGYKRAEIASDYRTGNSGASESRAPRRHWKRKEYGRWGRHPFSVTAPVPRSGMRKAENQTTSTR